MFTRRPTIAAARCKLPSVMSFFGSSNLGAARLEQRGHLVLGKFLFLHRLDELPRDNFLNRLRLHLLKNALLFEKVINARTHMFLAHCSRSFLRFRAVDKSSSGVVRVFL